VDDIVASGVCPFFGGMGFLRGNRSSSLAFDLSRPFWPMELDEKCCVSLSSVSSIQCKLMESKVQGCGFHRPSGYLSPYWPYWPRFRVRPQRRVHLAVQGGGRLVLDRAL